jgi:hypothetical protein
MPNIYKKTISDASLNSDVMSTGAKLAYALATVLNVTDSGTMQTGLSATQDFIDRVIELGVPETSPIIRAMKFDLNTTIEKQQQ